MRRILLLDSDAVFAASLAQQLADAYQAVNVPGLEEARAATGPFTAVIAAAAPGGGETLAAGLRAAGFTQPLLVLTHNGDGAPRAADDALAKPFRFAALLDKLDALVARAAAAEDAPFRIGPYLFHPGAKSLSAGPRKIRLTEKETAILKFLHAAEGTVAREKLLHEVWGYGPAVATHTLETHIYRLRKKIEPDPANARILLTEDGGYRLSG